MKTNLKTNLILAFACQLTLTACGVEGVNSTSSRLTSANLDGLVGTWKQNPYPFQENGNDKYTRVSFQQLTSGAYMTVTTICQTPGGSVPVALTALPSPTTYVSAPGTYNAGMPQTVTAANGSVSYQAQISSSASISADMLSASTSSYFNAGTYYAPCTAQVKPGNFAYTLKGNSLTIKNYSTSSTSSLNTSGSDVIFTRE